MPPEGASHSRGHKYPYLCSEILNSEISAIVDAFFVPTMTDNEELANSKSLTRKSVISDEPEPINDSTLDQVNEGNQDHLIFEGSLDQQHLPQEEPQEA